jgi:catechol 2,3-dioxygenase-like lactoylglutathione lyase family enzyme
MATVQVRYIVNDADAAIAFYCQKLGFTEVMHPAPAFAMLMRGDLRLVHRFPDPDPMLAMREDSVFRHGI